MINSRLVFLSLILALATTAIAACGGGSGTTSTLLDEGGIGGTGLRVGEVTDLGSILVDGIAWDIDTAVVNINGASGASGDVQIGHVARVAGTIAANGTTATATRVDVDDLIKGVIEAKIDANQLTVQGQTVQVDETTTYGPGITPASLDGLSVGNFVEIHGFVRGSGLVFATRIEKEDTLSSRRVTGIVQTLNAGAQTFMIGSQVVDYSSADLTDLPGGVLANGTIVRVRAQATLGGSGELLAQRVEREDLEDFGDNDNVEVEGFVTQIVSATQFLIGSQLVQTSASTRFEGGVAADLVVGAKVQAKGSLQGGTLVATEVEFRTSVRLESDIASIGANSITLAGLAGITIQVDSLTEYDGDAGSFGDLQVGDHVEIRARLTGTTTVVAVRLKETSADTDIELRAPVDASPAPNDPILFLIGIQIDTSGFQNDDFEIEDVNVGRAAFFAQVSPGSVVEVKGELQGGNAIWDEIELELDD